ncbi:kinase domain-containing protein [Pseudovirgaria hyperparasitica]|uniref:Kinase domain-containing protein n=1 Tax=Pseudovirgaria hyperparasitica TaxID=470096 RepID=A0A6A6W8H4_9PEZI|nr:kinase domain-containing protein [Pseudovirgaria hyperparasitica]KAF2757381.1 kinase domain-containing protein [Pseudovirgaria hyperparasitica]
MGLQDKFPDVHWIWKGAISYVYEVHPQIVVKVPKSGDFEREQFRKELGIYDLFSRSAPCASVVQCFHRADNGIFLEYMRDISLHSRLQYSQIWDHRNVVVTGVKKLEPLSLRKQWMQDLTQAVAFLESLHLAHGDLRPENILLDRDRLKLSDFDCTAEIGADFEACTPPYGRILNSSEAEHGACGTSGCLGPRTEQFALGSIYYLINYGFEVYGDQTLTDDHRERGPRIVDLLQHMQLPDLAGDDPSIDAIIDRCWHNQYPTIADLATATTALLLLGCNKSDAIIAQEMVNGAQQQIVEPGRDMPCCGPAPTGAFLRNKAICEDLDRRGLLDLLATNDPEQLGLALAWYRYTA